MEVFHICPQLPHARPESTERGRPLGQGGWCWNMIPENFWGQKKHLSLSYQMISHFGLKPIFVDNTMSFLDLSLWSSRSLRNERRPKRSRRSRVQVEILIEVATRGLTADPLLGSDVVSTLVDSFCCGIHLDSEFSTHPSASIHIHPGFIRFVVFCPHFFRGCVGTLQGRPVRWPDQPDQPDWPDWPGWDAPWPGLEGWNNTNERSTKDQFWQIIFYVFLKHVLYGLQIYKETRAKKAIRERSRARVSHLRRARCQQESVRIDRLRTWLPPGSERCRGEDFVHSQSRTVARFELVEADNAVWPGDHITSRLIPRGVIFSLNRWPGEIVFFHLMLSEVAGKRQSRPGCILSHIAFKKFAPVESGQDSKTKFEFDFLVTEACSRSLAQAEAMMMASIRSDGKFRRTSWRCVIVDNLTTGLDANFEDVHCANSRFGWNNHKQSIF